MILLELMVCPVCLVTAGRMLCVLELGFVYDDAKLDDVDLTIFKTLEASRVEAFIFSASVEPENTKGDGGGGGAAREVMN